MEQNMLLTTDQRSPEEPTVCTIEIPVPLLAGNFNNETDSDGSDTSNGIHTANEFLSESDEEGPIRHRLPREKNTPVTSLCKRLLKKGEGFAERRKMGMIGISATTFDRTRRESNFSITNYEENENNYLDDLESEKKTMIFVENRKRVDDKLKLDILERYPGTEVSIFSRSTYEANYRRAQEMN
ncbi:hypothetical protein TcasGA2_TC031781 [Tribolium castaneum]|uniref:Uncharacterized protein n=1 Tax=Tribolium castaneum TaxID=7070 RepID=A0A139W9U4_TRICA|nr:hypothetical protein TcasGA2_TC031781 [Tribolium castaneum]